MSILRGCLIINLGTFIFGLCLIFNALLLLFIYHRLVDMNQIRPRQYVIALMICFVPTLVELICLDTYLTRRRIKKRGLSPTPGQVSPKN